MRGSRSSDVQLFQFPFSHNCVKVRKALDLKGLSYDTVDINPVARGPVKRATGQTLVPALVDGPRAVADSTAILLYLEHAYPQPPLLPADPDVRSECLLLEDWADVTFMELTRRLAYMRISSAPDLLGSMFFPRLPARARPVAGRIGAFALKRRFKLSNRQKRVDEVDAVRGAEIAVARLGGRDHLVGDEITIADIALASMSAPLAIAGPAVTASQAVQELLAWGRRALAIDREFESRGLSGFGPPNEAPGQKMAGRF